MAPQDVSDLFAFPQFGHTSRWLDMTQRDKGDFFNLDLNAGGLDHLEGAASKQESQPAKFFEVPGPLQGLGLPDPFLFEEYPLEQAIVHDDVQEIEDLFAELFRYQRNPAASQAELKTWEGFTKSDHPQKPVLFATEAGAEMYDAALHSTLDPLGVKDSKNTVVHPNQYAASLLALTLGRASVFFTWDNSKASFVPSLDDMRPSGYSRGVIKQLQGDCMRCGTISRYLSSFTQTTFVKQPSPARVALARAVDSILLVVKAKLGGQAQSIVSILYLQSIVRPVMTIMSYLRALVSKLLKTKHDEQLLSVLFEETRALEHDEGLLRELMSRVLCQVSESWITFTQEWVGLKRESGRVVTKDGSGKSYVKVEKVLTMDDFGRESEEPDYFLDQDRMPSFVPHEVAQNIFQTGRTLRLLRAYHPEHALCTLSSASLGQPPPPLAWHLDWQSIQDHQVAVNCYETSTLRQLRGHSTNIVPEAHPSDDVQEPAIIDGRLQFFGQEKHQLAKSLLASIEQLNRPLPVVPYQDEVSSFLQERLLEEEPSHQHLGLSLRPHWSLLPILSFSPQIDTQARLINMEYMRLLFNDHDLQTHIALQRSFHLLGNGVFCSRLSHALFDPELETAERTAGVAMGGGVMGLRLRGRESWPPASSELRLALMGILADSHAPVKSSGKRSDDAMGDQSVLLGDLSFAVRDLSEEEIERCLDVNSLEAMDFLRLSYKPPAPLTPVFTPVILVKYDKIFKMLLRLLRLVYVTGEIFRDTNVKLARLQKKVVDNSSLRFRFEAQHFLASITAYFFDMGIDGPWKRFVVWLEELRMTVEDPCIESKDRRVVSLDELRQRHEQTLDQIMHIMLLRKRQQPVLKLLEEIFTIILQFSHRTWRHAEGQTGQDERPGDLYKPFKKKVDVFITVCRGLSEKKSGVHDEDESTIDQLLLQLQMSGYYGGVRM